MATRNFNVKNGLTVGTATIDATSGNANVGNLSAAQLFATANITAPQIISNIATGTAPFIVTSTTQVANLNVATAGTAGTVTTNAQPNITSVGTLSGLTVSGVTNLGNVGNVIITGGSSGFYLQTNGSGNLTWAAVPTGTGISNGTSNINIPTSGGNVTTSVGGTANVFVVSSTGANVAGTFNATGNANVGNLGTNTAIITTGNITTINSGLMQNGNSNITITANGNISLSATGSPDELIVTSTGVNVSGTLNATGNANTGNLGTGRVIATGNISGTQLISNIATGTAPLVVTSTTKVANLNVEQVDGFDASQTVVANTIAVRDTNGNLSANFFIGNGSQLTGLNTDRISNGTSNVSIPASGGNVNLVAGGNTSLVVTATGANVTGTANVSGNASAGNFTTAGQVVATGNVVSSANLVSDNIIGRTGALTITSAGTNTNINLKPNGTGNIDANSTYITNVKDPTNAQDAATKAYVDNYATTGIAFHTAVVAATTTTLATATGGTITYNNGSNGVGATLTTTGTFNLIDTANVQTVGTRILVKDEANAAWNGVYVYSNTTTITRATDADTYGPDSSTDLSINDYFFVSGGQTNKNTSWIVSAPSGTITFGTSNIVFSQFSSIQSYTAGTGLTLSSNNEFRITNTAVTAGSYGNGDRVATFTVNSQGQLTAAANIAIAANAANLTGTTLSSTVVNSSLTSVGTLGTLAVTGNANVGNLGTAGLITATGNVSGGNLTTGGVVSATGNVSGGNLTTGGALSVTGNANVGNIGATTAIFTTGNITTINSGLLQNGNSNVTITANGNVTIAAVGGTRLTATSTGANVTGTLGVSSTLSVTGNANVGNLGTAQVLATANITTPQVIANVAQGTAPFLVNSNTLVANLNADLLDGLNSATANTASTIVARDANGNVSANFFIGNGSQLTGITASQVSGIANGNSNVNIGTANGNVTISAVGNANIVVVTGTGVNVAGTLNATGNANVGNLGTAGLITATGNVSGGNLTTGGVVSATGNVSGGNLTTAGALSVTGNANVGNIGAAAGVFTANVTAGNVYANSGTIGASLLTGTLTTASQPNITSLGTLSSLVVSGNITAGNVRLNGGLTSNRSNVAVTTNTVIDQFAPATFRTAKYVISASGDNGYQSIETLLVHDGVDAYITIYGSISSNVSSEIVNLSANINGVSGNVSLYASNIGANVKVNVVSSYIQI